MMIWLVRTQQGEAEAANAELTAYLAQRTPSADDAWFGTAAGFLLGQRTEAELFSSASSSDPKKALRQECAAWYFAGMKKLLAGDKNAATDDFRKSLATEQMVLGVYQLARAELKKLAL